MALQDTSTTGLALAVRTAGSQVAFGKLIGRRQSTIQTWLSDGRELPAELVLEVERKLGISRHDLRPDLYPVESPASPGHPPQHPVAQPPASSSCPTRGEGAGGPGFGPGSGPGSDSSDTDPLEGLAA